MFRGPPLDSGTLPEATLALLAVLQPHPESSARLVDALASEHDLVTCRDWREVWEAVLARPTEGCVVEVSVEGRAAALRELQRLRRRRPPLALVVQGDFQGRELDLFGLGRIGVDGVLPVESEPSAREIRLTVARALSRALAVRIGETLAGRLQEPALEALRWSITHAMEGPNVGDLAAALGRSPETLGRELRGRNLPPLRRLLLWGRLFHAARLLVADDRSVESVALRLGYSSRTALARALRRETGFPPTEVVRRGGVSCVLEGFLSGPRKRRRARR